MNRIGRWFDERLGIFELSRAFLDRHVPGNINWFHTLGSATLILIAVQFLTGIALSMSYVPSPDHAYESVGRAPCTACLHLGCTQIPP